jgi:uncharacterized membrane protein YoaK (UPF0700 family)
VGDHTLVGTGLAGGIFVAGLLVLAALLAFVLLVAVRLAVSHLTGRSTFPTFHQVII